MQTMLAERLAALLRDLQTETEQPATFERIAAGADELLGRGDGCGLSLRDGRGTVGDGGATSDLARACDDLQYELGEGPCLDAVDLHAVTLVRDLRDETRWPAWGPRAAEAGVRSMLSVRLFTQEATLGALNLYSRSVGTFDADDVDLAWIYASSASAALRGSHRAAGLSSALASRHTIGMAQGMLMCKYGVTAERAFEVLRRYSNESNQKLRDVAEAVVEAGALPDATAEA
jgi:GAF domain-containing protein